MQPIFSRIVKGVADSPLVALPLHNANFAAYSGGSAVSLIGMWMQRIAIGWLTWKLTESGLWLGIVAFADYFPIIVFGPIAGAVADRWDRLRLLKTTTIISFVAASILWGLTATEHINVWLIVGFVTFQGIVVAASHPARLAFVPSLVSESELGSAVAIHSVIFNLARFIGPILAGFAILWSGVASAIAVNALTYLVFMVALQRIRIAPTGESKTERRSFLADLWEGISYTARHPSIAAMLIVLIAIGLGSRPIG